MSDDFLTNVETAFLTLFETNEYLAQYHWQRWDADSQVELPRGVITLEGNRELEGSPIFRLNVEIRFEGRPQKEKMSIVMGELKTLLEATPVSDLSNASVHFYGRYAEQVSIRRATISGLRVWTISFVLFACAMP